MRSRGDVLVLGATGTIGRAVCACLLRRGVGVVGTCNSHDVGKVDCQGIAYFKGNLLLRRERERLFMYLKRRNSDLIGLVDCLPCGVRTCEPRLCKWTEAQVSIIEELVCRMKMRGGGAVVVMSSTASRLPFVTGHSRFYAGEKGYLESYVRAASGEFAPEVRINGIAPGIVSVKTGRHYIHERIAVSSIPLRRFVKPDEIASMASFLLLDAASMTGQIVTIDGGLTSSLPLG